jgi:uncharacterized membrane protein YebE (DUF533 family)
METKRSTDIMFDLKQLLDRNLRGQADEAPGAAVKAGNFGGLAGGALAGGLVGLLTGTKTRRKIGKNALAYGGSAVLGGLAYKAWRDWRSGQQAPIRQNPAAAGPALPPVPPADSAFLPDPGQEADLNRALVRAMIGAAKADGQIDPEEQQRVFQQVNKLGLAAEMSSFVMEELAQPLDLDAIVASAGCAETAMEIYAASLIAIDPSGAAEKGYLAMLAARLKLDPGLVEHLHANVALAMPRG